MADLLARPLLWEVVEAIHYAYPSLTLLCFVVASLVSICLSQTPSLRAKDRHVRRDVILWLVLLATLGYIVQALLLGLRSFTQEGWVASQDEVVYSISSSIVWAIQGLALKDSELPIWYPYYVNWTIAILFELTLLIIAAVFCTPKDLFDFAIIALQGSRVFNFVILLSLYIGLHDRKGTYNASDTERQSLLKNSLVIDQPGTGAPAQAAVGYGATAGDSKKKSDTQDDLDNDDYIKNKRKDEERIAKRLKQDGNWWTYAKGFSVFFPLIWPVHSKILQTRAVLVAFCLFSMNFMNFLVPRQLGAITDALVSGNGRRSLIEVALYAGLIFAKSNACVGWLQEWLWQPVEFYAYDALNTAAQSHVMSLSSDFHASKEANDIFMDVYRGKNIIPLVDTVCFKVIPMFIDLTLVFAYLYYLFGPYMALNLGVTTLVYLYTTSKLSAMVDDRRRGYIVHHRREWRAQQSTISKWQLASYFNNIPHEEEFYGSMVKNHVDSQKGLRLFINIGAALRGLVMTVGLFGACLLAVYQVIHKSRSPGDFVVLLSYWQQLQVPLSFFSNMYRSISENMMDAERLLELFQTKPSIIDDKDAKPLKFVKGEVSFKNVSFTYDGRRTSLKGVDFAVAGGSTVGIVGETGGGKSTILRLLDRFYDATDGSIEIDGQDIRKITLKSLRESIGVVAQDTMLFNDTIMNNVRYARRDASDAEVHEACKSAAIHDKIITFSDGYNSKVGANGLKLSGGEKQRIAIARAILKSPRIVLLDEATSAVDTETEELIQEAFQKLCSGRTTFTVAHRLSTIMRADRILVIKDGQIVEDGSHGELIGKKGKYYDMWSKQIFSILDADKSKAGEASTQQSGANFRTELELEDSKSSLAKTKKTTGNRHANCQVKGKGLTAEAPPRLKPEAPEFVPRDRRDDSPGPTQSTKTELKLDPKEKHRREKEEKKREKEEKKKQLGLVSKAAKTVDTVAATLKGLQEPKNDSERSASASAPEETIEASGTEQRIEKPRFRRPRFNNRRHESKSQPSNRNMDGVDDSEEMNMGISGESQPFLETGPTQNRRVSAPGYLTSSNSQDSENFSNRGRSRRPRQWRAKNRTTEQTESTTGSGGFASQDPSADDEAPPNIPLTSLAVARGAPTS